MDDQHLTIYRDSGSGDICTRWMDCKLDVSLAVTGSGVLVAMLSGRSVLFLASIHSRDWPTDAYQALSDCYFLVLTVTRTDRQMG